MGILPDVRLLPEMPWWEVDSPQTEEAAVQMVLKGSELQPFEQEHARKIIEAHFGELFAAGPQGYRALWRELMKELLITWQPDRAVSS